MAFREEEIMGKSGGISNLVLSESSPEKAGVGGSIPSLATTFSTPAEAARA
jgi:hypothetical protein